MADGAWLIQGYDSLQRVLRLRVSPALSDHEIKHLLQRLVALQLNVSEVLAGSLRRGMKGYSPVLNVQKKPGRRTVYSCGENPHYVPVSTPITSGRNWTE